MRLSETKKRAHYPGLHNVLARCERELEKDILTCGQLQLVDSLLEVPYGGEAALVFLLQVLCMQLGLKKLPLGLSVCVCVCVCVCVGTCVYTGASRRA